MEMEKPTARDQLRDLSFLSHKLKVIGEYLQAMEADEMTGENLNLYQYVGDTIYSTASKISKILEDPNFKVIDGGLKQAV